MNNDVNVITIEQSQRYVTRLVAISPWQDKMLRRLNQLFNSGDGEFIVRKRGDEIIICMIGKPEVVKG